jgi:hypothetical protein
MSASLSGAELALAKRLFHCACSIRIMGEEAATLGTFITNSSSQQFRTLFEPFRESAAVSAIRSRCASSI